MEVAYSPIALRQLLAMPKTDAKRIRDAVQQVADAFPQRLGFVTELVGESGSWRLRKGDWRAVYFFEDNALIVARVEKRGEVYR